MHARAHIRSKFYEMLLGTTTCGESVFKNRARPFIQAEGWQNELPALVIYTNDETATVQDVAPMEFARSANIVVEIHAAADEQTDDLLDAIAEQVEIIISRYNWEAENINFSLGSTRMQLIDAGAQMVNGALAITFEMTYYSPLPDAGKSDSLDDLLTVANTYLVGAAESKQTVTFDE